MNNGQTILDFLGEILHILAILGWEKDSLNSGTESTNELLLDASNRCYFATQRYFALVYMLGDK